MPADTEGLIEGVYGEVQPPEDLEHPGPGLLARHQTGGRIKNATFSGGSSSQSVWRPFSMRGWVLTSCVPM